MTDDDRVERVARAIQSARAEYFSTPPDYSPERMDLFREYARAAAAAAEPELADARSALRYIRHRYGALEGVGWDRVLPPESDK